MGRDRAVPLAHPDDPPPVGTADLTANPLCTREPLAVPRDRLPDTGMDAELVHDELMLDGNARLNLATFVTTWMDPQASRLMSECADKNMIDKDESRGPPKSNGAACGCSPNCGGLLTRLPRRGVPPPVPANFSRPGAPGLLEIDRTTLVSNSATGGCLRW